MMKNSIIILIAATALSIGMAVYGWTFVDAQIGKATLSEETIVGNRAEANGLSVGFRAEAADILNWTNSFDFSTDKTKSNFKREEMVVNEKPFVYDNLRFAAWSGIPYSTQIDYDHLEGLQDNKIQDYYDKIQKRVEENGKEESGKIRLRDYLDYYPIGFEFQLGNKVYNSDNALTGLKVYDKRGILSDDTAKSYHEDIDLYAALNNIFKIPVIDNEYQQYRISKLEDYDYKTALGYETEIEKPIGTNEDFYQFDPIIVLQEENILDGKKWSHSDLPEPVVQQKIDDSLAHKHTQSHLASEFSLKNRMLFIVNNRTAKGAPIDVSQLSGGYGIYELPFTTKANAKITKDPRNSLVAHPEPDVDELKMVFPLDKDAEYVDISLSNDHRYLSVFSVKDGDYFIEIIDADIWYSHGPIKLFPASKSMTYARGNDESIAITNHDGYIAVLSRTEDDHHPYEFLFNGKLEDNFDKAFFNTEMVKLKHSTARYNYCNDSGLVVGVNNGKASLIQNILVGDPKYNIRNAALECAVIDKTGLIYRGKLKNNIVDIEYDMNANQTKAIRDFIDSKENSQISKYLIQPVANENWSKWE